MDLQNTINGDEDIDSACSTPFTSAPSSPGRGVSRAGAGYFFSAPASPMHFILSSSAASTTPRSHSPDLSVHGSFEFGFSAPSPAATGGQSTVSMISADELFLNGQIRPMKLPTLLDVDEEEDEENTTTEELEMVRGRDLRMRSRSMRRRTRSMSPMRHSRWEDDDDVDNSTIRKDLDLQLDVDAKEIERSSSPEEVTPPESTTTSRSSSSGRNSKRWIFLKDLLYRSKSEGRASTKEKFWHSLTFSPSSSSKEKSKVPVPVPETMKQNGRGSSSKVSSSKRRGPAPSAHEKHYTANRAVSEEMRKKTFLPYRQGLIGCLGFGSKSYGAVNGFARAFKAVSTR